MAIAMGWRRPDNVAGSSAPAILVGFFVATGGLLFGYDTGTINGIIAMESFKDQFSDHTDDNGLPLLTPSQSSLIVSILSAGTIVGSLLSAPVGDWCGRRSSLILAVAVFSLGVIFQICSSSIPLLLAGRLFAGVGVGAVSVLVPLYQSEMAPRWIRGTLVCAFQLFITLGLLTAAVVNILTAELKGPAAYRIPMGLQLIWALILSMGLLILPETPRYLVKRGMRDSAALSLSRLRRLDITHPALIEELSEIQANHEWELSLGSDTYKDIFVGSPRLGHRTLMGCGLQMLQQLTGVNFIMYYSTTFFEWSGINNPFLISVIINIVNVVSTVPGLLVVETWGRRRLLMVGATGMALSHLLIASFYAASSVGHHREDMGHITSTVLVVFVAVFQFFFAASWGPVAWVVTSEIYPLKVRAKSMSVSTASNWLLNFGIAYGTPYAVTEGTGMRNFGPKIFFIWGAFCLSAIVYVYFFVFETSKLSLEQIDEMYERVHKAWQSTKFEPSWSFQQLRDLGWSESGVPPEEHILSQTQTGNTSHTADTEHTEATASGSSTSASTSEAGHKPIPTMGNVDFSY